MFNALCPLGTAYDSKLIERSVVIQLRLTAKGPFSKMSSNRVRLHRQTNELSQNVIPYSVGAISKQFVSQKQITKIANMRRNAHALFVYFARSMNNRPQFSDFFDF